MHEIRGRQRARTDHRDRLARVLLGLDHRDQLELGLWCKLSTPPIFVAIPMSWRRCDGRVPESRMSCSRAATLTARSSSCVCGGICDFKPQLPLPNLVEMMAERGLSLAHTTIMRWVHSYVPEFERRWNRFARPAGSSWRVDETYVKIRGKWVITCIGRWTARVRRWISG